MLQIRTIALRGKGVEDAVITFDDRSNIVAGDSDTGKSYLVRCIDYILGADKMKKRIDEAAPYSKLFVEFENSKAEFLTLERGLSGGNLAAHSCRFKDAENGQGEIIVPKRKGKSHAKDVTATLFAFAGLQEALLRRNDRGNTNRLTIRTILPLFLVDEISIIDERSPVLGRTGFDETARKRAFAYMLSGKDDEGVVAAERKDIAKARLGARLGLISDLLAPIENRLQERSSSEDDQTIDRLDEAISKLSQVLSDHSTERNSLQAERREAISTLQHAESQIIAIDELAKQYGLLSERYRTDLERLDFISEGAHFFEGLQEVRCPLCDQLMSPYHAHRASEGSAAVYQAARAEASKILAHKKDLQEATEALQKLRSMRQDELESAQQTIKRVDDRTESILAPAVQDGTSRLDQLVARRIALESVRSDEAQASSLRHLKMQIESATDKNATTSKDWEPLPSKPLREFCDEIEKVLKEWSWEGEGRVEFDETEYDIKVDGQQRQSHGKGVRAVLHSAFVVGLLRYCYSKGLPHPGTVIIDSPLTSYKKGKASGAGDGPVSTGIETAFWDSLRHTRTGTQIIIIENKEPPRSVADSVHYEWFAGKNAQIGQRRGFIPTSN